MDKGGQVRRPGMDITPPGGTAAAPSSKPVITNSHQHAPDPMMSTRPSALDAPTSAPQAAPTPSAVPEPIAQPAPIQPPVEQPKLELNGQPVPEVKTDAKLNVPSQSTFESLHKLKHEEPFFGHVGKHKKSKLVWLIAVIILAGVAAVVYFFLIKAK